MDRFLETANVMTLLVLIFAVVGGVVVIAGNLTFSEYVKLMDVPVAGVAVGRGLAARRAG